MTTRLYYSSFAVVALFLATTNYQGMAFVVVQPQSSMQQSMRRTNIPQAQAQAQQATRSMTTTTTTTFVPPRMSSTEEPIVSPFDDTTTTATNEQDGDATTATATAETEGPLDLTWENVELVLDEMRPYLIQDGGNVIIQDIDGPVVKLELQGACGTCPSSTQTMKMGLERGLKEKIPEIQEVIQAMPEGPELNEEQVDVILEGVRPFLQVAGGSINLDRFEGLDGLQPAIWLNMEGNSASLNSVKLEIAQRLQRHFMMSGLRVEWVNDE